MEKRDYATRFLNGAGRIAAVPVKQEKKLELLRWLAPRFETGRMYAEVEVNELLEELYDDFPYLRRLLVENGFLDRDSTTGRYWVPAKTEED